MQDSKAELEKTSNAMTHANDHPQQESMLVKPDGVKTPAKHQQPIVNRFGVREKTKHSSVWSEVYLRTPEYRRPVPLYKLSPYSDSDDENTKRWKRDNLGTGLRNSGPPKAMKCSFCPRKFIQKTHLEKHEEKHQNQNNHRKKPSTPIKHQQKAFKCTVCPKEFTSRLILSKHQQLHANQK